MERIKQQSLTKNELLSSANQIKAFDWKLVEYSSFSTSEVVNLSDDRWAVSEVKTASLRDGHMDYFSVTDGCLAHFKTPDNKFEALYEPVAYELGCNVSNCAPTTLAVTTDSNGMIVFGVLSLVCFPMTLTAYNLSEPELLEILKRFNPDMLIAESVLTVWWRNHDWGEKLDSIAVGKMDDQYYYYPFDRSHVYRGPNGDISEYEVEIFNIAKNMWNRRHLDLTFKQCLPYIEKIENISDSEIERVIKKWTAKLCYVDTANAQDYLSLSNKFSAFLIEGKKTIRKELENFFITVDWAVSH